MLNDRRMSPTAQRKRAWHATVLLMIALPLVGASLAGAQEASESAEDPWSDVETMVVVGSGSVDALTSTSISVTAFDSSELEAIGASDVSDVAAFTPNLEIRTAGSTNATLFIRGVGLQDSNSNAASAVAVASSMLMSMPQPKYQIMARAPGISARPWYSGRRADRCRATA